MVVAAGATGKAVLDGLEDLRGRSGRDEPADVIVTAEAAELPAPDADD